MDQFKYNFSDDNLNIATLISKKQFKIYSQFINKLSPLKNIIQTYKMTQNQYVELQTVPRIIANLPILSEQGYDLAIQKTTIYIILNRMFIDNCKNLAIQLDDLNLNDLINSCDKTTCEENLRVLRNYANHTTIPISGLTTESLSNGKAKIKPTIKRQDLKGNINKHDKEINQIKADKKIGENILIPKKTRGVFPLPLSSKLKIGYTDSLLLKMVISSIINDLKCS